MRTIEFSVTQQRIKNKDSIGFLYKGTHNYLKLKFIFNNDWDGCAKAISLGSKQIPLLLDNEDSCVVPEEAFDKTYLSFYLVGKKKDYRIESEVFKINLS